MIKLYQFPEMLGLRNASPFCLKMETYLKMAEIPFENVVMDDPRIAPKSKGPFIEEDGKKIGDTGLIIDHLKVKHGDVLDGHLSAAESATVLAFSRLIEEHLYWVLLSTRWGDEDNWAILKDAFFGNLPIVMRGILPTIVRRKTMRNIMGHGMGKHSVGEVEEFGKTDLMALSDYLDDKPFFMGDKPTSLDASAYAMIYNFVRGPFKSAIFDFARTRSNLVDYCDRLEKQWYSE